MSFWTRRQVLAVPLASAVPQRDRTCRLIVRSVDLETGQPVPATVAIRRADGKLIVDNRSYTRGVRSGGEFVCELPPGKVHIEVQRGFDYSSAVADLDLTPGGTRTWTAELRRRTPLRKEGWVCG